MPAAKYPILLAIFVLLEMRTAAAGDSGEERGLLFQSTADVGVAQLDDDLFVDFLVEQQIAFRGFELALAGPFRLRVLDRSPSDSGGLRKQDWDEPSDFARIVPYIAYRHRLTDGDVDIYCGQLNGVSLGHGSIAGYYFNSTEMDHYQGGASLYVDWAGNGLEYAMDDVVSPDLFVGRIHIAPFAWFMEGAWPRRLELGYTLGLDIHAPYRVTGSGRTTLIVTGGDLSLVVVEEAWGAVKPYADVLFMDGDMGLHVGLDTSWTLSKERKLVLFFQGEYRFVGADFHPAVLNPFYEQNRWLYPVAGSDDPLTLADQLRDADDLPRRHGFMLDASLEWQDKLRVGARYDTEGADRSHWVLLRIELTPLPGYHLTGFYAGQDVSGGTGLFSRGALIGAAFRGKVYGPADVFFHFTRRSRRRETLPRFANETGGGAGVSVTY